MGSSTALRMAAIRGKDTTPELLLRRALWRRGHRYRVHAAIPGRPDLAFIGQKLAVFVDGCFWHRCPEHYRRPPSNRGYWDTKIRRNVQRDNEVNNSLREQGWTVLRYWEHEVLDDLDRVVAEVSAERTGS